MIVQRKPGVQKPHCSAWQSMNDCWTGESVPSGSARPSTVVISCPFGCHREHQARPHRLAVEQDGAGPADPVLAADVGAGQPQVMAQRVGEQPARGHDHGVRQTVDQQRDLVTFLVSHCLLG